MYLMKIQISFYSEKISDLYLMKIQISFIVVLFIEKEFF